MRRSTQIITSTTLAVLFLLLPKITEAKTLAVPFTSQAPSNNWSQPWQDACEETSIIMIDSFYQNKTLTKNSAKQAILTVFKIKNKIFGHSLDENASEITSIINDFLPWSATTTENPTLDQIKNEIDNEHPVIIPVYGRVLGNPHFRGAGPVYHVLVIKGYDDDKGQFITNDPGTRYGLDFRYFYDTIMNAIHDFLPSKKTSEGKKIVIFTNPDLGDTAMIDADNDGLNKADEFKYGSQTWLKDSDSDGFPDGVEVLNGFSPVKKFIKL